MDLLTRSKSAGQFDIPIDAMYKIATRSNDVFGVEGYQIHQEYVDPARQIKEREYLTQQQGEQAQFQPTKRGNFLDDYTNMFKGVPSPSNYYQPPQYISDADLDRGQKLPQNTKRSTYIEEIFDNALKRQVPGVGEYNVIKTDKQVEQMVSQMKKKVLPKKPRKLHFLNELEFLANTSPGPGNYNDRYPLPKIHENQTKPAEWIEKHQKQHTQSAQSLFPDVGTYTPTPVHFETFDQINIKSSQQETTKVKGFGSEQRFPDPKQPSQSLSKLTVPSPAAYNLIPNWPGKEDAKVQDKKVQNWMDTVTQGVTTSIYYEH